MDVPSPTDGPDVTLDVNEESFPEVCVVTHPLGSAGENATRTLLAILATITTVSLVTADLPEGSEIRDRHEVIEPTEKGAGQSNVVVAATRFLLNQFRMCRIVSRREEGVVLFFGAVSYVAPILWARLMGKTVVVEPRGDVPLTLRLAWERRMPARLARFLAGIVWLLEQIGYRLSDAIVTYTPSMATELGLDRYDYKLFTDGARYVDAEQFAPITPFEERGRTVGFLGRIDGEKGVRELSEVARRLPDDVTFRFIGDGELSDWLEHELAEEIAAGGVQLTGWVDHHEVPRQLNRLRLLVMPSRPTEGLPTTMLEALACGTPVYATGVSGVPDVVVDGETGFIMHDRDPKFISEGVNTILERNDLGDVSKAGRALVVKEYSFDAAVRRYRAILNNLE